MPQANTSIKGNIVLQQGYPLYVNARTTFKQPELLNHLVIDVKAGGSLDKIDLAIKTSGLFNTHIDASLSPLQPALPFTIHANWQHLGWPLLSPAYIETKDGSLSLQGDLDDYNSVISGSLDIDNAPLINLDAEGKGSLQGLMFSTINAQTLGGTVVASVQLDWVDGIRVSSDIATKGVQLDKYWPEVKLRPSGDAKVDFKLESDNDWRVDIHDINVAADIASYPLTLQGKLTLNQDLYWHLNGFSLSHGDDSIRLDGIINEQFKLGGEVDVKSLTPYLAGSKGSAFGYFTVIGNKSKPWLNFDLFADHVALENNKLSRAYLNGRISLT